MEIRIDRIFIRLFAYLRIRKLENTYLIEIVIHNNDITIVLNLNLKKIALVSLSIYHIIA